MQTKRARTWMLAFWGTCGAGLAFAGCGGSDDDNLFAGAGGAGAGGTSPAGKGGKPSGEGGTEAAGAGGKPGAKGGAPGKGGSAGKGEGAAAGSAAGEAGAPGAGGTGASGKGGSASKGGAAGKGGSSGSGAGGPALDEDPVTCAEAAVKKSNLGCDFWPTVTPSSVWSIFDFAVVVVNPGDADVDVKVSRKNAVVTEATVGPHGSTTLYLPWISELKGADGDSCGNAPLLAKSLFVKGGAYHVEASSPVAAYQFSALEYQAMGGPPGKSWASCPGKQTCASSAQPIGCFSYSNDASLLLPSSALTGSYRVASMKTMVFGDTATGKTPSGSGYFTVTGTEDGTTVKVRLGAASAVLAGTQLAKSAGGATVTFPLDAGDVMTVVGQNVAEVDVSGSLVQADKPVQVLAGMPCVQLPFGSPACDHVEESVFPIETLGKRYLVPRPSGPKGAVAPHVVRIYGNVDGTKLSFPSGAPAGAPTAINAGEVVELDGGKVDGYVTQDLEIVGDHELTVGVFLLGGTLVDPQGTFGGSSKGDPSLSYVTAVEQYRRRYAFVAPNDYDTSFVDVVRPKAATLTLDGVLVKTAAQALPGNDEHVVVRIPLGKGALGAHVLEASQPVGIQVLGYGDFTSYHYPGGSNLTPIAEAPPLE